jgi:hypothetical protein
MNLLQILPLRSISSYCLYLYGYICHTDFVACMSDIQVSNLVFYSRCHWRNPYIFFLVAASYRFRQCILAYITFPFEIVEIVGYAACAVSHQQAPNLTLGPYVI